MLSFTLMSLRRSAYQIPFDSHSRLSMVCANTALGGHQGSRKGDITLLSLNAVPIEIFCFS